MGWFSFEVWSVWYEIMACFGQVFSLQHHGRVNGHVIAILQSASDKLTSLWPERNQRMKTSYGS